MATPIRMPDIGTVEGDVLLSRWLKEEGDPVAFGEPLLEVETDKGVNALESVAAGVLLQRLAVEGAHVGVGDLIAYIGAAGEAVPDATGAAGAGAAAAATAGAPAGAAAPAARQTAKLAPALRALAEKYGVDLSAVKGTGPGGVPTRQDILLARGPAPAAPAFAHGAAPEAPAARIPAAQVPAGGAARRGLTGNQAIVARKVAKSWREKPVYHVSMLVDMGRAASYRSTAAVSYDALFVRAAGMALADFPSFRTHLDGEELAESPDIAVALAVSVGEELYAPVVKAADSKSVGSLSREIEELAGKAQRHALSPADMTGGCMLVSNLGMLPVESFDAIIYPEHSAALAIGAAMPTPVADAQGVRVALIARLTLSVDHRVINGKTAARFLARVKEILEGEVYA